MKKIVREGEWKKFIHLCSKMGSEDELEELFSLFLTQGERDDLAVRLALIRELLDHDRTQRDIADELGVSIGKITRGANELKRTRRAFVSKIAKFI